jgi:hypothetical protein
MQCVFALHCEYSLIRLEEYEEARRVRRMIEKILPREQRMSHEHWRTKLASQHEALENAQERDRQRLEEKVKALHWAEHRRQQQDLCM